MDSIADYEVLVALAKAQAATRSLTLPEWELQLYNDAQPSRAADR